MYPLMTGLVAGAFVLSSLYHVFGVKQLKEIARFSLVFSFALLPCAMLPLMLHLQQPSRGIEIMLTPHFTSAIAAFGIVFTTYSMIVGSELWFVYRHYFVETVQSLRNKASRTFGESFRCSFYAILTLGAWDIRHVAVEKDERAVEDPGRHRHPGRLLPPRLCRLHLRLGQGQRPLDDPAHAGHLHLFGGSFRGRPLHCHLHRHHGDPQTDPAWKRRQDPTLPTTEELKSAEIQVVTMTVKYLIMFMVLAISLELLDLIFRGYTAVKSWDILRRVIYGKDFSISLSSSTAWATWCRS